MESHHFAVCMQAAFGLKILYQCKTVKNIICAWFFSFCVFFIYRASFLRSNCTAELKRGCLQSLQVSPHLALSLENVYEPALTRHVRVRV